MSLKRRNVFCRIITKFPIIFSATLDGKNKAVEVHAVTPLVGLLKDSSSDVKANAAGALMM